MSVKSINKTQWDRFSVRSRSDGKNSGVNGPKDIYKSEIVANVMLLSADYLEKRVLHVSLECVSQK